MMNRDNPWTNSRGNRCVSIPPLSNYTLLLFLLSTVSIIIGCIALIVSKENTLSLCVSICAIFLLLISVAKFHWLMNKERLIILRGLKADIDLRVAVFLEKHSHIVEKRRRVYTRISYKDQSQYILILLSNNTILECRLLKRSNGNQDYIELLPGITAIKDTRKEDYIQPWIFGRIEPLLLALCASVLLALSIIMGVVYLLVNQQYKLLVTILAYIMACLYIQSCTRQLSRHIIHYLTVIPLYVLRWIMPGLVILVSYITIFLVDIPLLAILVPLYRSGMIRGESAIFCLLAFSSILPIIAPKVIRCILQSILQSWGEHRFQDYMPRLALYVTTPKVINCILGGVYLLYLIISSWLRLEHNRYIISESMDNAILQSFLVYLALYSWTRDLKTSEVSINELRVMVMGLLSKD